MMTCWHIQPLQRNGSDRGVFFSIQVPWHADAPGGSLAGSKEGYYLSITTKAALTFGLNPKISAVPDVMIESPVLPLIAFDSSVGLFRQGKAPLTFLKLSRHADIASSAYPKMMARGECAFKVKGSYSNLMAGRQKTLRTTQRRMLRQLTNAHESYEDYDDHSQWLVASTRKVEEVMQKFHIHPWTALHCAKVWNWAGKVAQTPGERWKDKITTWSAPGGRPRGRPKTRWSDSIIAFHSNLTGFQSTEDDWRGVAREAKHWAALTDAYVAFADLS